MDTTNKGLVLRKFPEAMLAHIHDHEFEIVRPTQKGERGHHGWRSHRVLGRGTDPKRAWRDALQKMAGTASGRAES